MVITITSVTVLVKSVAVIFFKHLLNIWSIILTLRRLWQEGSIDTHAIPLKSILYFDTLIAL